MKTMKLVIGIGGSMLALALLGGRAQAQAARIVRGDLRVGAGGGAGKDVTGTWHEIIYDHQVPTPAGAPRRLLIHADGTIRLVDGSASPQPLASDKLDAASLAALKSAIAAAAGDANYVVRSGAMARTKSLSGGFAPSPGGPATSGSAALELRTRLDVMAAVLARSVVAGTR